MKTLSYCLFLVLGILLSANEAFAQSDKVITKQGELLRLSPESSSLNQNPRQGEPQTWIVQLNTPSLQEYRNNLLIEGELLKSASAKQNSKSKLQARLKAIQSVQKRVVAAADKMGDVSIERRFTKVTNSFVIRANEDVIEELRQHPDVKRISEEQIYTPVLDTSVPYISANRVWDLQDANENNITGQGVTVAIIDTGVNYQHDDLGGCLGPECKVIGGYDFTNDDDDPMEDDPDYRYLGHGTHVAGIVAANGRYRGVAPDASILAYKVCDVDLCPTSLILAGLERASDPDGDILTDDATDVVNISLGSKYGSPLDPVPLAINTMAQSGIVVVVGAGNDGGFANLGDIASAEKAITVAANNGTANYFGDVDDIADFSSGGPVANVDFFKPEVNAPGRGITAPCMEEENVQANCTLGGTSMASPHVAGVVALLKQSDPALTVDEIRSAVINTAQGEEGVSAVFQGAGLVNALDAVQNSLSAAPAIAYFGDVQTEQPNYTQVVTVELKNRSEEAVTYNLSLQENTTEGVVFSLQSSDSVSLEPGQTVDVSLQINVDVELLKSTLGEAYTIENELAVNGDQDNITVPVILTPFAEIDMSYEGWWPRHLTIFNQQHNSMFYGDYATSKYYLPLGDYSVISVWDESDKLSFVVEEDIDLYITDVVFVDKDLAVHRVSISSVIDAEDQEVSISNESLRNGGFLDISYLPAKYSQVYGRDQEFNLIHKDLLFSDVSENFELRIHTLHSSSFDESDRTVDFYSFIEKLSGVDSSLTYELNAEQMQSLSFNVDAFDQFDDPIMSELTIWSRSKPEYKSATFAENSGIGKGVFTLDDADEKVFLTEPYTMTVYSSVRPDSNNFDLGLLEMEVRTDDFDIGLIARAADFTEQRELRMWPYYSVGNQGDTSPEFIYDTSEPIAFDATHKVVKMSAQIYSETGNGTLFDPWVEFKNPLGQGAHSGFRNDASYQYFCDDDLLETQEYAWREPAPANCDMIKMRGTFSTSVKDATYESWLELGVNNTESSDERSFGPVIEHIYTSYEGSLATSLSKEGSKLNLLATSVNSIDSVEIRVQTNSGWQVLTSSESVGANGTVYSADLPVPDQGYIGHLHIKVTDVEGNYAEQMIQGAMVIGKDQSEVFTRDTDLDDLPDYRDQDIDGDEVENMSDSFPYDPTESVDTDLDGVGNNADTDDDGDGVEDAVDAFPLDQLESVDTDGDGIGNNTDDDDDNDSTPDAQDAFPLDASESVDTDGDGVGNNTDSDDDGDGVADAQDAYPLDSSRSSLPAQVTNAPESGGGGSLSLSLFVLLMLLATSRVARQVRVKHYKRG